MQRPALTGQDLNLWIKEFLGSKPLKFFINCVIDLQLTTWFWIYALSYKIQLPEFPRSMTSSMKIEQKCVNRKYFNSNPFLMQQYLLIKNLHSKFWPQSSIWSIGNWKASMLIIKTSRLVLMVHVPFFFEYSIQTCGLLVH